MFDKIFSGFTNAVNAAKTSRLATQTYSRRDFLKGTGLLVALLSFGNFTNALQNTTKTNKVSDESGGYGSSGYGV